MGSGGGDDLTISIGGNAAGLNAATSQAQAALGGLGTSAHAAGNQASQGLAPLAAAIQQTIASMQQMQAAMGVTAQQGTQLGGSATQQGSAWQQAGGSAQTYQQQLGQLQQQMASTQQQGQQFTSPQTGAPAWMSALGTAFTGAGKEAVGFLEHITSLLNPLNLLHDHVFRLIEVMGAWRLMEGGLSQISDFASQIFQLPIAMEKAQGSWQYMYNDPRAPGQSMQSWMTQGQQISNDISNWTKQESINLPYTRQDLISAITAMAPSHLSAAGVEQYMPVIADLASTRNPNLDLQTAAYAVSHATNANYMRMLMYELYLNPDQLTQYGYDASNPSTMLQALQNYSQAQGSTSYVDQNGHAVDVSHMTSQQIAAREKAGTLQDKGAAYNISHSTFWGEWSSFEDRLQNSQLATGEYGPFGALKKGLEWVNNWIDTHADVLDRLAKWLGTTITDGMTAAKNAAEGFFGGLQQSGFLQWAIDKLTEFSDALGDPKTQQSIKDLATTIGNVLGTELAHLGTDFDTIHTDWVAFKNDFTPEQRQQIKDFFSGLAKDIATALDTIIAMLGGLVTQTGDLLQIWSDLLSGDFDKAGKDWQKAAMQQQIWDDQMVLAMAQTDAQRKHAQQQLDADEAQYDQLYPQPGAKSKSVIKGTAKPAAHTPNTQTPARSDAANTPAPVTNPHGPHVPGDHRSNYGAAPAPPTPWTDQQLGNLAVLVGKEVASFFGFGSLTNALTVNQDSQWGKVFAPVIRFFDSDLPKSLGGAKTAMTHWGQDSANALLPLSDRLDHIAQTLTTITTSGSGSSGTGSSYSGTLRGPGGYRVAGAIGP